MTGHARAGRGGRWRPVAAVAVGLALIACGEPDPEAALQEASEELEAARADLASADEQVAEIRGEMRRLEERLADAERIRREAQRYVAEAEAQVLPVPHLPRDRARPEPTTARGRASDRVRQGLRP